MAGSRSSQGLSIAALRAPDGHLIVARLGGGPGGCVAPRLEAGLAAIKRMQAVSEARRNGIGHRLLAHLATLAADDGRSLETEIAQPGALTRHEQAGSWRIPPFPPCGPDPLSLAMARALGSGAPAAT